VTIHVGAEREGSPLIAVNDLTVEFDTAEGTIRAVDGVSFELAAGEVLAVIGESGSGKTVSAEMLLGLQRDVAGCTTTGSVLYRGRDLVTVDAKEIREIRGREISMVFQDPVAALNPVMSIGAQMGELLRTRNGMSRGEAWERSVELLDQVGLPSPEARLKDYPFQLSGGMCQRVMNSLAVALEPAVLVADEATTALDVTVQAEVLRLLRELRDRTSMAMVFISHDLAVASEIADRIAVMYSGRVVEMGPAREIVANPRHPYTRALLASTPNTSQTSDRLMSIIGSPPNPARRPSGCSFHPRCAHALAECRDHVPPERTFGSAHRAECHLPEGVPPVTGSSAGARAQPARRAQPASDDDAILVATELRREFVRANAKGRHETFVAVDGVSFELRERETLAIVGESGSGKTTVARMIGRLLAPSDGSVRFRGDDMWNLSGPSLREFRRHIQMVFQDPLSSLNPRMTIGDTIREPWIVNKVGMSKVEQTKAVDGLLADVGLRSRDAARWPREFSGGQRQRIAIARALAMKPAIVICDEPVSALDVSVQAQILNLLRDLQEQYAMSYLFISHDLAVVRQMAQRVAVMQLGKVVEIGAADDVYARPQHPYTRRLLDAIPGRQATGLRTGMVAADLTSAGDPA
jgi:peptide/nickel transport system ATP-binding protein